MNAVGAGVRLEPSLAGEAGRRLFMCRHVPAAPSHPVRLVVLCYPLMHEYERCHRLYRQLAAAAAQAGLHVLRFDYRGTGDSPGESEDISFESLCADTVAAIEQGQRLAGATSVTLVGTRVGANVAAEVAASRTDVTEVLLWNAVTDRAALASEWLGVQNRFEAGMGYPASASPPPEILGMPLAPALARWLMAGPAPCPLTARAGVKQAWWLRDTPDDKWPAAMVAAGIHVNRREDEPAAPWRQEPMEAVVPASVLKDMVAWLTTVPR